MKPNPNGPAEPVTWTSGRVEWLHLRGELEFSSEEVTLFMEAFEEGRRQDRDGWIPDF